MWTGMRQLMTAAVVRAIAYGALWWVITEGRGDLAFGAAVVAGATAASLWLTPPGVGPRWLVLPGFILWFLWESLRGGIDVARRALDPRLPLAPDLVEHRWRLTGTPARVLMANLVNLLPGTLTVEFRAAGLRIHVIDRHLPILDDLDALENRVGRLMERRSAGART